MLKLCIKLCIIFYSFFNFITLVTKYLSGNADIAPSCMHACMHYMHTYIYIYAYIYTYIPGADSGILLGDFQSKNKIATSPRSGRACEKS